MSKNPASNFSFLKKAFKDIIVNENDTDQTGRPSSVLCQRKTFTFIDGSVLYMTEYLKHNKIDAYQYDWYRGQACLCKFHSEPHEDKKYQTDTEPFHIHVKGEIDTKRLPNFKHEDLFSILELIKLFLFIKPF